MANLNSFMKHAGQGVKAVQMDWIFFLTGIDLKKKKAI